MYRTAKRVALVGLLGFVLVLPAGPLLANGRLPNTTFVRFNPGDPNRMVLGATFGLLISADGGKNFDYLCEQAVAPPDGFGGADPIVYWAPSGTLTVASFGAVSFSKDNGCNWQTINMFGGLNIADLAPQPDQPNVWYVAANDPNAAGTVYRTTDDGATYKVLPLSSPDIFWESVRVAPSMPKRIYVAGFKNSVFTGPHIARSDDGGATWKTVLMTLPADGPKMVAAQTLIIHPTDPNTIFIAADDVQNSNVALLRSTDGGLTGTLVQHVNDIYRDLVFSEDGKMAWLATGARVNRSTDGGQHFTLLPSPNGDACLTRQGSRLYACGSPKNDQFSLAVSDDTGDSWKAVFTASQLRGPWSCPAGSSVQKACQRPWALIAGPIGAAQNPPANTGGGTTSAPGTTSQGDGSGTGQGGAAPAGPKSGCGCATTEGPGWLALAILATLARGRRLLGSPSGLG